MKEIGYLTSDDALDLEEYPSSVIILGAGAIGLEACHQLAGLGSQVTVVQRGSQIMREADADVAGALETALTSQGVRFQTGAHLLHAEIDPTDGQKRVWFERNGARHCVSAQEILFALGRTPCTDNLELNRAGVATTKKGGIEVGPDQRARSKRHVFAAGDVCGPYEIVHIAIQQAELAARNAARHVGKLGGSPEEIDYRLKLFVLFTEPQMAHVGLTEKECQHAGRDFAVAKYPFNDHGKAIVKGETDGFVKLISRACDGRNPRRCGGRPGGGGTHSRDHRCHAFPRHGGRPRQGAALSSHPQRNLDLPGRGTRGVRSSGGTKKFCESVDSPPPH